jgi:adenosylcobinamide-phosphate synthase
LILEAFLLAVVLDLVFGEPKPAFHPVVWIGTLISFMDRHAPRHFKVLYGCFMALFSIGITVIVGYGLTVILYSISPILSLLATAYLLKSTFSFSFLWKVSRDIYEDLRAGRLDSARSKLPALVGRDVSKLDADRMSSCVIESLGESFVDGIFSPLFYFILFGLPGALAYRAINTLDSMVGYKDEKHIQVGMPSARIDDLANFIPARLAVLFIGAIAIIYGSPAQAIRIALRDGRKPPSINSGYPMAAFAGSLSLRLEKLNYYVLGEGLKPCGVEDIQRSIRFNMALSAVLIVLTTMLIYVTGLPLI